MPRRVPARFRMPKFLVAFTVLFAAAMALNGCLNSSSSSGSGPRAALLAEGQVLFNVCAGCHGVEGEGSNGPPLRHSDFLIAERLRPVRILLLGLPNAIDTATTIRVNGIDYEGESMPPIKNVTGDGEWTDREIAAVLTYVRAILNDSLSLNCTSEIVEDNPPVSICDKAPRPQAATDYVSEAEVKAVRDSLIAEGILVEEET